MPVVVVVVGCGFVERTWERWVCFGDRPAERLGYFISLLFENLVPNG